MDTKWRVDCAVEIHENCSMSPSLQSRPMPCAAMQRKRSQPVVTFICLSLLIFVNCGHVSKPICLPLMLDREALNFSCPIFPILYVPLVRGDSKRIESRRIVQIVNL